MVVSQCDNKIIVEGNDYRIFTTKLVHDKILSSVLVSDDKIILHSAT